MDWPEDPNDPLISVENALDKHERVRRNSTDTRELREASAALGEAIEGARQDAEDDEIVDEYQKERDAGDS